MKLAWSLLLCLGCSTTRHRVVAPDVYEITCTRSIGDCHARAAKLCERYIILDADERTGYFVQHGQYGSTVTPVRRRELVVRCE